MAEIPDKLYFKIGEVAAIADVPTHVLRFWETEFRNLAPRKGKSGHRQYRRKDVETVMRIKELLYDKKLTIAGARRILSGRRDDPDVRDTAEETLRKVRTELEQILTLLGGRS